MENDKTLTKKNLKGRLSGIMIIYMDGLPPKKKAKLEKYLDAKLNNVVAYYMDLLKKKKRKVLVLKPFPNELQPQETIQQEQQVS